MTDSLLRVARRLAGAPGLLWLDGSRGEGPGRHSLLFVHPTRVLTEGRDGWVERPSGRPVDDLRGWLDDAMAEAPCAELGPFRGGVAGLLGFELGHDLDAVRASRPVARTPALWVGAYPSALALRHDDGEIQLVGPAEDPGRRALAAAMGDDDGGDRGDGAETRGRLDGRRWLVEGEPADDAEAAPHYRARVAACMEAIRAGELFEVNYTERVEGRWTGAPFALQEALRVGTTGSYAGYLDAGAFQVASVSPEALLTVDGGRVRTRPIKGTRHRADDPQRDRALAEELLASEKDRAENVMIVDLSRNDLTRVCELGSVEVTELCGLESFAGLHHLVSTVEGRLAADATPIDALLAAFPAGSISGAPKLRSLELIAEHEGSARGAYTGSLFYASRHGRLDSSVLIRTVELVDGVARYGTGGAVTTLSDPAEEWAEALLKRVPFDALAGAADG